MVRDARELGGVFIDERVDVTGRTFISAIFHGCVVVRDKDDATELWHCIFERCRFVGDGWPAYIKTTDAWEAAA